MSVTSVLCAVVLGLLLLAASGCWALYIGCGRANVETEAAAVHDREADQVVVTSLLV